MAITETTDLEHQEAGAAAEPRPVGFVGLFGTGDHKAVGRMYIATSLVFLIASGIVGELVAVDRVKAGEHQFLHGDALFQMFTVHSVGAVFLALLPLTLGIAIVVVPLQVGSRAIAFPRAASLSFWAFLLGGILLIVSYAVNGGPGGPRARGVDLWAASFIVVLLALLLATVCVVTTVFSHRTPSMTLDRTPLFSWSMVIAGAMWLLTLPVLIGVVLIIYVDHQHGQIFLGQDKTMYTRILWALHQPQVYAFAVPVLGFAGDVVPVMAKARYDDRFLQYQGAMVCIGAFGVLGFGAFAQTTLIKGVTHTPVYIGMAWLAILPVLGLLGLWGDLFRRGRANGKPASASPLAFAVLAVLLLLAGTLTGAVQSIYGLELQGTLFDGAQSHFVLLAAILAAIGALYYWSTKIVGRPAIDKAGLGAATLIFLGAAAMAIGDALSGGFGSGDEVFTGSTAFNALMAVGGIALLLGVLSAVAGLLPALRPDTTPAPADPWNGHTLEWLTSSPPDVENFAEVPFVTSEAPLLDRREASDSATEAPV